MAMGIQQQQQQQQQQHHHQQGGSPPMFPGDFVEYGQQYDPASDASSRQPREGTRGGRYRRPRSPSLDDDSRFTTAGGGGGGGGGEGPRTPNSDAALHDAVLAQAPHQQQRVVPTGPVARANQPRAAGPRSGPPSMANASQNRRSQPPPVQSQLPPYVGENPDEWSPATREAAAAAGVVGPGASSGYSRRRTERHARRQSSTGSRAAPASSEALPSSSVPQMSGGASPRGVPDTSLTPPRVASQHQQQHQVPNPGGLRPPSPPGGGLGDDISRIQSPSISKSVLEPLQRKMLQYHNLMEDAQGQMAQLDEELRVLQERRRQTEQRFIDAKAKHDEYERQHLDVERALRGDFHPPQPAPAQLQQQQQQQLYNNSPPRTVPRPASSIMSYDDRPMSGHSSVPRKGKLRFSLFGR
ncbi:hypothetical protein CH63R_03262 [Colletotrichum higginsianum IMI 349063]|uniref:Uncharacterized protein n=2 Tax=Colletotrichum higginsianum (strain IMI 349063) TaxID=759273 RepID=A0A1B7YR70_COLHI|nr:hypothetical protein CH63R_03262 [Colletotrichum higginsianum IMI 349063]OBR14536.1 hypothetical protein CH63R_03262 [Colletotrichum higginsianum IMI 349063]